MPPRLPQRQQAFAFGGVDPSVAWPPQHSLFLPGERRLDRFARSRRALEQAEAILEQRGAWFLFLPPYSPDLNPIEMAFAKLKAHLRRIGARTIDALWRAIGDICALYSEQECWNFLKDAGYAPD